MEYHNQTKTNNELLTICSLTYNHKKFIRKALDGFLKQKTNFSFEVLVNDDASTDGTTEILEAYQQKYPGIIKPVFHNENQYSKGIRGLYARNLFPLAQGKYIALCEGDDYWTDKNKLQKQVDFLENYPAYTLCGHDVLFRKGIIRKRSYHWDAPEQSGLRDLLVNGNYLATGSLVFRNIPEVFEFLKKFTDPPFIDFLLCIGLARHGQIRIIKEKMGVYRVHEGGTWSGLTAVEAYYKTLPIIPVLFDSLGAEQQNNVRIFFINGLQQAIAEDAAKISGCDKTKSLLLKMGFPEGFCTHYLCAQNKKSTTPAELARRTPRRLLIAALREKRKNLRPLLL